MGGKAGWHWKLRQRNTNDAGLPHEYANVVQRRAIFDDATRLQFAQARSGFGNRLSLLGDNHQSVAGRQNDIGRRNDVLLTPANHCNLDAARQVLADLVETLSGVFVAQCHFAHMESLRLRRKFWPHLTRHEIDA